MLANVISRALADRDWTDVELATRIGLSRSHVNRLKNRRVRPTLRDALLIARALDADVEAIFDASRTLGTRTSETRRPRPRATATQTR